MLAGDGAANVNRQFKDFGTELLGAFEFAGAVGVIQNQRMQIAVAGMEYIHAAQAVFGRQRGDCIEHRRQRFLRYRAVHAVVIGRHPPCSRKRSFAPGPEAQAFGFVLRNADFGGAAVAQHRGHARDFLIDFGVVAVGFAQQDRHRIERIAGMDERFDRACGDLIHHFKPGRYDASGDHVGDCLTGAAHVVESGEDALRPRRLRQQFDRDLCDDGEQAFGAGHQCQQVIAGGIKTVAADFKQFAFDRPCAQFQNVVHGETVLEAVHAAGVFSNIAADRAGDLARRVGRVIQA